MFAYSLDLNKYLLFDLLQLLMCSNRTGTNARAKAENYNEHVFFFTFRPKTAISLSPRDTFPVPRVRANRHSGVSDLEVQVHNVVSVHVADSLADLPGKQNAVPFGQREVFGHHPLVQFAAGNAADKIVETNQ